MYVLEQLTSQVDIGTRTSQLGVFGHEHVLLERYHLLGGLGASLLDLFGGRDVAWHSHFGLDHVGSSVGDHLLQLPCVLCQARQLLTGHWKRELYR